MSKKGDNLSTKEIKPPYLSLTTLEKLLGLLSTRRLDKITTPYLEAQGFSKFDIGIIPSTLKFLKIIEDGSKIAEIAKKLHLQGEAKKEALQSIVKNAYQKLFKTIDKPYEVPNQELTNEFIASYELSPRVAKAAVPAFLWLCEESGMKEKSLVPRKRLSNSKKLTIKSESKTEKTSQNYLPKSHSAITTKLDIIKEFVEKIDPQTADIEKVKMISGIVKDLLGAIENPTSNETKTDSGEGTA